jgi:hypothetical protein
VQEREDYAFMLLFDPLTLDKATNAVQVPLAQDALALQQQVSSQTPPRGCYMSTECVTTLLGPSSCSTPPPRSIKPHLAHTETGLHRIACAEDLHVP